MSETITPEQRREQWRQLVDQWIESGLSGAEWCRRHEVSYDSFLYYKNRFKRGETGFREVIDPSSDAGITIQIQEFVVKVDKSFDSTVLLQLVATLTGVRARG